MSSSQPNSLKDDGPKLREEKHFADFYPDLDQQELLPIIVSDENNDMKGTARTEPREPRLTKQMIYNERVTVEPITINKDRVKFKRCKVKVSNLGGNRRIPKQYHPFGFHAGLPKIKFSDRRTPYFRKTDKYALEKANPLNHLSRHQSNFRVEYDMDEQDELYLQYVNEPRKREKHRLVSHELFEIAMTVLENEWFFLEKKIPPRISSNLDISTRETRFARAHYEAYGSDDGTGLTIDQPCAVCGGTECDNSNAIVFCDGCDVAVHQECYGVVFIPEGQWLCRRCMISRNRKINCLFCPSHTGAFKQTDTGSWGHVVCGIWIPELFFVNPFYMEPIEGIDLIPKSRWKLNCYICRQRMGACIQCSNKNCFAAYHVTCAKRAGLYMDFGSCSIVEASSNTIPPGLKLLSLCDKHSPPEWPDCEKGIMKTRQYFEATNNNSANKLENGELKTSTSTKDRWMTNRGTPIAPNSFALIVQQLLDLFKLEDSVKLSTDLCKYWSMKRELKRGAPLVRKFDPNSFSAFTVEELNRRVEFAKLLSKDLAKLQDISRVLTKRQKASQLRNEAQKRALELYTCPEKYILQNVILSKLEKVSSYKALMQMEITKAELSHIINSALLIEGNNHLSHFKKGISEFFDNVQARQDLSRSAKNEAKKLCTYLTELMAQFDKIDFNRMVSNDFIIEDGEVKSVPWRGPALMEEEELDPVGELSQADLRKLKSLLG